MPDLWFSPTRLRFQSVHVRGPTEWVFFELCDNAGTTGLAEITATQLNESVLPVVSRLASALRGERLEADVDVLKLCSVDPDDCEADRTLATAVSGLRCAVADALAQRAQMSLTDYLCWSYQHKGVKNRTVELYANINRSLLPNDRGPVDRSPDAFRRMALKAVQVGFAALKCAPFDECRAPFDSAGLPREVEAGLARFAGVKEVCGPEKEVYVDCHSRFDLESSLVLEVKLREADAAWFEEPVDPLRCSKALKQIRQEASLPVVGGELGYGLPLFQRLMDQNIVDIVMPDVMFCGGPVEAHRIGSRLESKKGDCVSLHCPSGPISLLASAHATTAFGNSLPLEHAYNEVDWRHEVLEPCEKIQDGCLHLPDGFGLGARVNPSVVERRGRQWEP